ncbi:MAG: ABC transporter substrate-binding protein [Oscillospiraceae bacterium]|nr:ABC transporter substrate-binding protein [Oscillospiraceae bacterium]
MLFKRLLIILFAAVLVLPGCGQSRSDSAPEQVTLVLDWTPNTNHTGFFAADELGYFAEEGLSFAFVQPPEDGALALVAAGRADFGISFQEEVLLAANARTPLPVVAIAAVVEHNTGGILSLSESGITRFRDLEGMRYGSWQVPIYDELIKECVRLDGGNPGNVDFVPNSALDNITGIQRDFDAVWVFEGWDKVIADRHGFETNFIAFRDISPIFDYYTPVLITSEERLNSDVTAKFLRAAARGFEYARDNPEEAADILHRHVPEMDRELLAASQRYLSGEYYKGAKWGYIDSERWNAFFSWMRENEFVDSDAANEAFRNVEY